MGPTTAGGRVNAIAVLVIGSVLLLLAAIPAQAAGDDAHITADITCDAVEVTSSKDISNVVVRYADGTTERFEKLSGRTWSVDLDQPIDGLWVKSGDNKSGDGPGYGQWFPSDADCGGQEPVAQGQEPGTEPDDGPDRPDRDTTSQAASASIIVEFDCLAVIVESSKDISNIVVSFADGATEKFDGLSGHSWSRVFDRAVAGVWVKSGNNASGDGPGYGEWFPSDASCGEQASVQDTTPERDAAPEVPEQEAPASPEAQVPAGNVAVQRPAVDPAVAVDTPSTANTAVLGVAIERPVTAAGSDASVAGSQAQAAPSALARTGAPAGWLLSIAMALSVYGLIALDLSGRRSEA